MQPINNYAIGELLRGITQRSYNAQLYEDVMPVIIANPTDIPLNITLQSAKNTVIPLSAVATASATTTIGTVPAGKVWRIINLSLQASIGSTLTGVCQITLNSVAALTLKVEGAAATMPTQEVALHLSYESAYVLTAGQIIQTIVPACWCAYNIAYIEENA